MTTPSKNNIFPPYMFGCNQPAYKTEGLVLTKQKLTSQLAVARRVMTGFHSQENKHYCHSILMDWQTKFIGSYYHLLPKRGCHFEDVTAKLAQTPLAHAFVFIHDFLKAHGQQPVISEAMKDILTEVHKKEAVSISRHLPRFIHLKDGPQIATRQPHVPLRKRCARASLQSLAR